MYGRPRCSRLRRPHASCSTARGIVICGRPRPPLDGDWPPWWSCSVLMRRADAVIWTGLSFTVLGHRDGRFLHVPGLFAFARRDFQHGSLLLCVGQAQDLSREAGPAHPHWDEALQLGMDELHVHFPVPRRIDRLQLLSHVVRHTPPLLNRLEEAVPPTQVAEPARLRA